MSDYPLGNLSSLKFLLRPIPSEQILISIQYDDCLRVCEGDSRDDLLPRIRGRRMGDGV